MNSEDNRLAIVIPVHNRRHFTQTCLQSLHAQTRRDFEVIVVDDGSTDGTSRVLQTEFPETILLQGDGNLWWTAATNMGVEYALNQGAAYVMTLNNDTIPATDFVEKMLFWAERAPRALLGALAVDAASGRLIFGGERINWKTGSLVPLLKRLEPQARHGLHDVTHYPGRGLLIPSEVFKRIGLFDAKRFPHYAADYDFTHRAVRAGYEIYCNYDARLLIYPEASGSVELRQSASWKNYYNHLFGIKGAANLKVFTYYAWNNCPLRYRPWFMLRGYAQRIFGYWIRLLAK